MVRKVRERKAWEVGREKGRHGRRCMERDVKLNEKRGMRGKEIKGRERT